MIIYSSKVKILLHKMSFRNKYDVIANEISKEIFEAVISNRNSFNKDYPHHNINVKVSIERIQDEYVEKSEGIKYCNFDIKAVNDGVFALNKYKNCKINIKITIPVNFSEVDYQSFNYNLYEIVRHEIEHKETFCNLGEPDQEYINLFNKTIKYKNLPLLQRCELISKYVLHPQELPSYAKSIYYVSKKRNIDFKVIIKETTIRIFFNNIIW